MNHCISYSLCKIHVSDTLYYLSLSLLPGMSVPFFLCIIFKIFLRIFRLGMEALPVRLVTGVTFCKKLVHFFDHHYPQLEGMGSCTRLS